MRTQKLIEELTKKVEEIDDKIFYRSTSDGEVTFEVSNGRIIYTGFISPNESEPILDLCLAYGLNLEYKVFESGLVIYDKQYLRHTKEFRELVRDIRRYLYSNVGRYHLHITLPEMTEDEFENKVNLLDKIPGILWDYDQLTRRIHLAPKHSKLPHEDKIMVITEAKKLLEGTIKMPSFY